MAQILEPGAHFNGTYTVVRLIGRGGIGEVYEAKHDFLGRRVAIKCLRTRSTLPKTAAQRMAKEAQALCALDHPNIIRIHDAGVSGDLIFMVTELLEGGTLRDKLEAERRLLLLPALRYHLEWADALVQVHAAGIIHRDLKPENVFITQGGVSKLLDFGAALDSKRITMVGHTVGTPAYMAPEHLSGDVDIDARADIYPLGLMLFEALTGQHPFVLPSDKDLPDHFEFARRHIFEPWPKLTDVLPGTPPDVEAIVDRCLAKDRDERFPSMAALRDALRTALEEANKPAALPLVSPKQSTSLKTKPMPRQTALRLERGLSARPPRPTERMTPPPPIGAAVAPLIATAPMEPSHLMRAFAMTQEDRASLATPTPAPVLAPTATPMPAPAASPAMVVAMPPKPIIPSRAPVAIAVLSIGSLALALGVWLLVRTGASPETHPAPTATATATATAEVAPVIAPPPSSVAPPPSASAAEPPVDTAPPVDSSPSAAPTVAPKPEVPRPIYKPKPATTPQRTGPVPIFER